MTTITETTSLNAILSETGKIYLSVDGYGTLDQTGSVQILKKPDATVRKAYLIGDGTTISSSAIGTSATLNGTTVNWDRIESTSFFYSYLADVTDILKPTIDSAASGILNINLDEGSETYSYEGLALAVLFDDPNQTTDNNVILYFGGLPTTGATSTINFSSPVDLSQVLGATLGLGIGFSYAAGGQTSQVSVNGQPLSLVAGNYDDGVLANGGLFTVGGFEDNPDNPSPASTDPETDDELYNLLPFINNGDSSLTLTTINPSNDDHIFFAHLTLGGIQTTNIPSTISFSSSDYQVLEDGSAISSVTLTRSGSVIGETSVTLTLTDGTAVAGDDYDGTPIVVNFADGQTTATVAIPIIDNTVYQGDKTINLALSNPTDGAILGSQITSILTIVENDPQPIEKYNFTYFYGNGDSYSGYAYALSGTYSLGQLPDYYDNETGSQQGYYVIDSVEDGENGTNGYVSVTSYTDADTGFGTTTNIYSGLGYYGLGSESGSAFNANPWTGDHGFSSYYEADLPAVLQVRLNLLADNDGTPGEILANNQVGLNHSFFVQIQVGDFRGNAAGVVGLNLDFAWDGLILESINFDPTLAIDPKFSFFQQGTLVYDGFIDDLSGGSLPEFELGQAIGVNQLDTFALLHFSTQGYGTTYFTTTVNVNDTSLADDNPYYSLDVETSQTIQVVTPYTKYNFTYYYDNGDSYTGYVYAAEGTYTEDQVLEGYANNETGNQGYYQIGSIIGTTLDSSYNNQVYIISYTDLDTGFDTTTNIGDVNYGWDGIHGYSGLGSEYAYAYDVNGNSSDPLFGAYPDGSGIHKEADIINQKYTFTYTYGNGDSYSGYGYALAGTYTEGQVLSGYLNETNLSPAGTGAVENNTLGSSWGMDSVYHFSYTFTNVSDALTLNFIGSGLEDIGNESWGLDNVKVTAGAFNYSNDFESDSVTGWSRSTRSTTPAGSRNFLGEFSNDTVSLELNDVALNGSVTVEFDLFIINSWDGTSAGVGPDKFTVNTSGGQTLLNTTFDNHPGQLQSYPYSLPGYYTINSVEASTTSSSENNRVYVTSYFDGDTGYGETTSVYSYGGYSGLGSEYGYAYTSNWSSYDALFGAYPDGSGIHKEADLVIASLSISDNSGNANDSSIKFTTQFPSSRTNYTESDLVRPNFADTTKYFDITNNGSGILQVSDIVSNVAGVTTNFVDDLLINPGQSQRIQLTYDPSAAGQNFSVSNGLVLFTNDPYNSQYAIALSGKSTFNSDINYDGRVGAGDLGALNNARKNLKNGIYDGTADINGDYLIDNADLTVFNSERNLSLV
ncbi:hypothetical protein H6F32_11215 [Anabaena sp. FACHB-1237]|nr:Calx-beta domain-containing protein [Anabaena sp. FACHB-1237]MBD2138145.1 hypothetical protein [Anabaena sp. FACHB-1237]